jgi:glutathione S-transferase
MVEVDLGDRPPWLYEKNPEGRVPAIEEDNGYILPESRVIMDYLEERYPESPLLPTDAGDRGLVRVWLERFDNLAGPYYRALYRGEEGAMADFEAQLDKLDTVLEENEYLAGGEFTQADIAYLPWILRAEHRGVDFGRWENLQAWIDRCAERPSVAAERETVGALA